MEQQGNEMVVYAAPRDVRERAPAAGYAIVHPALFLAAGRDNRRAHGALQGALDNGPHYPLNVQKDVHVEKENTRRVRRAEKRQPQRAGDRGEFWGWIFCATACVSPVAS
ncbi:hypothetical protein LNP74_12105 [Klebsiella pneumoniae subsp. pneumoniae]|nr:hypothetical protein [Klebsiella pneumoniae subsp. pneumoniae]